ncbi:MAG: DUF58 domain-containing protein [Planctomycetaceae bacterium]|nr:DUF58 domain-containing protein [Planctomycetaceae bacterium]
MKGYIREHHSLDSRQFTIAVKRLADNLSYGTDSSPYRGAGLEYVQSRPYVAGDPIKAIDWRVTARTGKIFIKEYETPKRLPAYLLVDTSASMMLGSATRTKYEHSLFVAGGLALACLDRVSPVGVMSVGSRVFHVQPSLSKPQVMQWLHHLRHFRYDEKTTLSRRIVELGPSLKNRALVVVLSDMHDPAGLDSLKRLAQEHDCVVIQFQDPAETGLQGAGLIRAQEAETGRTFVTHGRAKWLDQTKLESGLKRAGIDHLLIRTDQPYAHTLRNFFQSRNLLGRGAR